MEERRPEVPVPVVPQRPLPLREPVPRSIVAVAPPPPEGARITYRLDDPTLDLRRPAPALAPALVPEATMQPDQHAWLPAPPPIGLARMPMAAPPPALPGPSPLGAAPPPPPGSASSMPVGQPPAPRPVIGVPVVAPALPPPPPSPAVVVPIVSGTYADYPEPPPPSWPHWSELLDGPRPDAARLRQAPDGTAQRLRARLAGPDTSTWQPAAASPDPFEPSRKGLADHPDAGHAPSPTEPGPSEAEPAFWPAEPSSRRTEPASWPPDRTPTSAGPRSSAAEPASWPAADMAARRPDPRTA